MLTATTLSPSAPPPSLNLVSRENLLNPHPVYRHLRETEPVHWSEQVKGWILTRHEDVSRAFRDPRLSADRTHILVAHQLKGLDASIAKDYTRCHAHMMLMKDGAEHTRLRRQANPSFTPAVTQRWLPSLRRTIQALLDKVQDAGRMDMTKDVSGPYPAITMAEIFGIPVEDRAMFQRWANDIAEFFGGSLNDPESSARRANASVLSMEAYLGNIVEERRKQPGEDVISHLIAHEEQGGMKPGELVANLIGILNAGHVTTIDQFSNGVYDLLTHPDQLELLRTRPELMKNAVEEVLRYTPSVPFMHRIVTEDLEMGGKTLRKGQVVFLGMAAANRDPRVFPDPERFDITRENNRHLAFAFGEHACMGSPLARKQLEIGLEVLFERMPGLALDVHNPPVPKTHSMSYRGFLSLPLVF